jgi:N,N'-diacetyllegionaminate synthase
MPKNFLDELKRVFVIAEAGSNWKAGSYSDDLQRAKDLIKIASKSGADAVKFQIFRSETTYAKNSGQISYLSNQGIKKSINELFENLSMPYEMIPELATYCKKNDIQFMSTPFSIKDAEEIDPYVRIHKLASFELNHVRLIEFLISTNKPVLLSTGASSVPEIDFSVNLLKSNLVDFALLQCTSCYPASLNSLNLDVIPFLNKKYNVPVGFSDHSIDPIIAPIVAVSLGARVIEKHFTINKKLDGPDHSYALEPEQLKKMVDAIRNVELVKGKKNKEIIPEERDLALFANRSLQTTKYVKKGEIFKEGKNFNILRPGNRLRGLSPTCVDKINGKKAICDIFEGDGILDYK